MTARRTLALAATLAFVAGSGACGSHKGPDSEVGPPSRPDVTIEVENRNFNDARVYLVHLGARTRLGQVSGNGTATFSFALPPDDVRIEVSFIGGGGFVTDSIPLNPGDELVLQIMPDAHRLFPKR